MEGVLHNIQQRIEQVRALQHHDGSWRFCIEGSLWTDCFMIMTLRAFGRNEGSLIMRLAERIARQQGENGAWKLYKDEPDGNLSATIQAYAALLASEQFHKSNENMKRAEAFIIKKGGLSRAHFTTKFMLAVFGQYPYPKHLYIPPVLFLLPAFAPVNIYEFSNAARVHLIPMAICINKRFVAVKKSSFDISHLPADSDSWFIEERTNILEWLWEEGKKLASYPIQLHQKGYKAAETFMLGHIEENGTLNSYASSTFCMIYALLALGYTQQSPIIERALNGLRSLLCETDTGFHLQNFSSTVWDTALLSYALQEAGVPVADPMIQAANQYLLKKQHNKQGDWIVHAPGTPPGGWGFSNVNTFIPDNDDTAAVLRALSQMAAQHEQGRRAWEKGVSWLLSMQNSDGGWAAFERDADNGWLTGLPIENAKDFIIDDSSADITGRVLEFLGNYAGMKLGNQKVERGVHWLLKKQRDNGSWYGKWGICYIYGTWAALTGLRAAGVPKEHEAVQKAVRWLESIQNSDGGWGESCRSSEAKRFVPVAFSTPSQTAWAVDALLQVKGKTHPAIERGVSFLLRQTRLRKDIIAYPTGLGLPGQFYMRYYSYNYIFPLLALAHYEKG